MNKRRRLVHLSIALALFLIPWVVFGRAGGGHSYSGGSSSSSGSGGGGGFEIELAFQVVRLLFWLTFEHPVIGIPIDILVLYLVISALNKRDRGDLFSGSGAMSERVARTAALGMRSFGVNKGLDQLRTLDPDFSQALFMDFVYALYAQAHRARGEGRMRQFQGYFNREVAAAFDKLGNPGKVSQIIVGGCTIDAVSGLNEPTVNIAVEFEACYTEGNAAGNAQTWYSRERWVFSRKAGIRSRSPERISVIGCPHCGAPLSQFDGVRCGSCKTEIEGGEFDWCVINWTGTREMRPPVLTTDVQEVGTDLPTIVDPDLQTSLAALPKVHPDFQWTVFQDRVRTAFLSIQQAWTQRNWEKARPFETDRIFQTHAFWINEYRRQKLQNVLDKIRIQRIVAVRVSRDRFFTSFTVRIYASMLDTTRTEAGKVLTGSTTRPREFSEYWTFIRSVDAQPTKPGALNCPSCGAPLKINVSGNCEYCKSRITSGQFDWVLSRIEQDEAYGG